jgi:glycerol transport system ATP-binding protein
MNIAPCRLEEDRAVIDGHRLVLGQIYRNIPSTAKIEVGIRPEYLCLAPPGEEGVPVNILKVDDIGRYKIVRVGLNNREFNVVMTELPGMTGDRASLLFDIDHTNIYVNDHLVTGESR